MDPMIIARITRMVTPIMIFHLRSFHHLLGKGESLVFVSDKDFSVVSAPV
jgi:hypothetical protein